MADYDDIARRAVDGVTRLAARAARFAGLICIAALLIGTMSFALGLEALEGGIRTVWIVLGLAFGAMAVGRSFIARRRLASVARHADEIVADVRSLLQGGHPATRTMVDTIEADERQGGGSVVVVSREFYSLRDAIDNRAYEYPQLMSAMTALTTFPGLILAAIAITVVFAMLVPIFLLALALG
jgi:hypothetical protein